MAKKRRTSRRRSNRRSRNSASTVSASAKVSAEPANLAEEYSYVIGDLQRMGLLALVLVGFLVGLSFFL